MTESLEQNTECWIPGQPVLNDNCKLQSAEIANDVNVILSDLTYEDIVNMQDVTGLDRVQFTDRFDLGKTKKYNTYSTQKAKQVGFLDKFSDPKVIAENEKWETLENEIIPPEKKYLRTRNKP